MSMEIKRRIGLPSMQFHVMNRGARKADIFANDDDRGYFVHLLGKFTLKHQIRLIAWCLMSNHYHLESEGEGTALVKMMHDLDGTYATFYNQRHGGNGCLFQGRFKCMGITDEDGLAYVSRYIHANPLAFGVRPEEYPWSSCRAYLGTGPTPSWLDPSPVLGLMDPDPTAQSAGYRAYLQAVPPPRPKAGEDEDDRHDFYRDFLRHLEERCRQAMRGEKGLTRVPPKSVVIWIARKRYGIPCSCLSELFGDHRVASVSTTVFRLGRQLKEDPSLATSLQRVYEIVRRFH